MGLISFFKTVSKGNDKKSRLIRTFVFTAAFVLLNGLITIPFMISGEFGEGTAIGLPLRIAGFAVSAAWLGSIIAARFLKLESILRGFFFYGLLGMFFFALGFAAKLIGGQSAGYGVQIVFDWFSVMQRPLAYVLQPLIGMSEFYGKAIVFGLLAVGSGVAARSIVRQREFEEKMAEKEQFEEQSKKST